jgi:hypothetical protein
MINVIRDEKLRPTPRRWRGGGGKSTNGGP